MPEITVMLEEGQQSIPFNAGQSLRDILDTTDFQVRSGCRGMGACGLCRVRIEAGKVRTPTSNEQMHFSSAQLAEGIRLACQVIAEDDLQITILSPARESGWRSPPHGIGRRGGQSSGFPPLNDLPGQIESPYGVAVDLGTTHIHLSFHELSNGQWVCSRYALNPQMDFGSDVLTRLVAASESKKQARTLGQLAIKAIGEGLLDIATREGINLQQVVRLVLVGNTAMLALLSGRNYELLLQPRHWMSAVDCLPKGTKPWAESWGIHPQARIETISPLAGFVGSDLLAGVLTTHLTENEGGSLLIDFGTNSEIALWDGQILRATSAAGGPAFEGCGISCGVPVEPGAIYDVRLKDGIFDYSIIAGSKPSGVCGSGLVDFIANLVGSGSLNRLGQFTTTVHERGFELVQGDQNIVLNKRDVDMFQRAKAAIGVGIQVLLTQAGMRCADLRRIYVGGAFGRFLNVENAQAIGLLPMIQPDRVELCGNIALAGCEEMLLSPAAVDSLKNLGSKTEIVNLSQCLDFEDIFLENLYLQPM